MIRVRIRELHGAVGAAKGLCARTSEGQAQQKNGKPGGAVETATTHDDVVGDADTWLTRNWRETIDIRLALRDERTEGKRRAVRAPGGA